MALPPATEIEVHFHVLQAYHRVFILLATTVPENHWMGSLSALQQTRQIHSAYFCPSWLVTQESIAALDWASGSFSSPLGLLGVRNTKRAITPPPQITFLHVPAD